MGGAIGAPDGGISWTSPGGRPPEADETCTTEGSTQVDDQELLGYIGELVEAEHRLERQTTAGGLYEAQDRLEDRGVRLDQCWDLLHQRRAHRDAGPDPRRPRPRGGHGPSYLQYASGSGLPVLGDLPPVRWRAGSELTAVHLSSRQPRGIPVAVARIPIESRRRLGLLDHVGDSDGTCEALARTAA
jgi:hypothetical protein